jgi:hypothetical protein
MERETVSEMEINLEEIIIKQKETEDRNLKLVYE